MPLLLSYPAILALIFATWNAAALHTTAQRTVDTTFQFIAIAILTESLRETPLHRISWVLLVPGLFIFVLLVGYHGKNWLYSAISKTIEMSSSSS
jgi:hypothetical protein